MKLFLMALALAIVSVALVGAAAAGVMFVTIGFKLGLWLLTTGWLSLAPVLLVISSFARSCLRPDV